MLQLKVVEKSGLNRDGTFLPPAIHPSFAKEPKYDMKTAMIEAEMVMGSVVADVLEKTGIHQTLTFPLQTSTAPADGGYCRVGQKQLHSLSQERAVR